MANKKITGKHKPPPNTLPYVQVAAFCEQILEDKEGVYSAIRIFDRLNCDTDISAAGAASL